MKINLKTIIGIFNVQWLLHIFFIIYVAVTLIPLLLVLMVSFTDEKALTLNGYSLFPAKYSFAAYEFLFNDPSVIVNAYLVTILVTLVGTATGLLFTTMLAYPLSRKDYPFRTGLSFYIAITMLFNGGLVPWYLVYTKFLGMNDSLWALILPNLLMSALNVFIARTFFTSTIPPELIECAQIDGAGEFRIYFQVILRLSLPVMATIGLFTILAYWNDWWNSLIFITDRDKYSLQYLLNKILRDINVILNTPGNSSQAKLLALVPTETVRMAMAVIGMGPVLLVYPYLQKYIIQGMTIGAVKG